MDKKRIEFPCTKECLVYASCNRVCFEYKDYVQEAYREAKYKCFRIIPEPPQQIKELAILMNRIEDKNISVSYYPDADMIIIYDKEGMKMPISVIGRVRRRDTIKTAKNFPEELKQWVS